jgi:hypothetical protein
MSQIKFSQKSIQGLPEALAALNLAVTNAGTTGANALVDAINAEVTNRDGAISSAISTEVTNRNTAIDTAIQNVLGAAPAALDTLKEIADYISVNPNATVADAINAAITAANQAVTDLTAAVDAEKQNIDMFITNIASIRPYSDNIWGNNFELTAPVDGVARISMLDVNNDPITSNYPIMVLNHGTARLLLPSGVSYEVPVYLDSLAFGIDEGLLSEITDLTGSFLSIQYFAQDAGFAAGADWRANYNF